MIKKYATLFGLFVGFMILVWGIFYIYRTFVAFSLISTDPSGTISSDSTNVFRFNFNRKLKTGTATIENSSRTFYVSVENKTLVVDKVEAFYPGQSVVFVLKVTDENDNELTVRHPYLVERQQASDLSPADIKRQTEQSDSFEGYNLTDALPLRTLNYVIDYTFPDSGGTKMPVIVTVTAKSPSLAEDDPQNLKLYRKYRAEAMRYLEKHGFNRTNYELFFSEPYLLEDYQAKNANLTSYIYSPDDTGAPTILLEKYPFIADFPHRDLSAPYEMSYSINPDDPDEIAIEIGLSTSRGRQEALKWLRTKNINPLDHVIHFTDYPPNLTPKGNV